MNMDNTSILDQIINNQKAEEITKLDAVDIVNNLLSELSKRERDILTRRYGLHGEGRETLEMVGKAHQLTRERIRQIESSSVKKLQELKNLENYVDTLKKVITQLLEEHGGIMEKLYLLNVLVKFSANGNSGDVKKEEIHKNHLDFLISKLLHLQFEELSTNKNFLNSYILKYQNLDHIEEVAIELLDKIRELKKLYKTEDVISMFDELESYDKYKEKFNINYNIDISSVLGTKLFEEKYEVVNNNKVLYSILKALKNLEQNKFGYWGIKDWREVKPKTINDKIYLVLKNHGKPMHFEEIANRINQIIFDKKKANAATVHNELILDGKYILVGRGLYGLKEWGYKKGTVADVITEVLNEEDRALAKEEIIEKVLEKRFVKKATIILALMNREKFEKIENKYLLKKSE
jgi:cell division protein ZapA (FtsZ GTPase activity inhibitor)